MTRDDLNLAATALLDTLDAGGAPEGHVAAALDGAGVRPAGDALALLVGAGLLRRAGGHRFVPGPAFSAAKAALAAHRVRTQEEARQ